MAQIFWVEDQSHWIRKFTPVLESTDFDGKPNVLNVFQFAESAKQKIKVWGADSVPDIALLDANMNGNNQAGFLVSNALQKKWPGLPVIYLSEHSGTEIERDALESFGATDFIAKHQRNVEEVLCWRIKAVLRQQQIEKTFQGGASNLLESGDLAIDLDQWNVYWKGQRLMNPNNPKRPLAPMPRKILRELVEVSPRPLSAIQIAEKLDTDSERFSYASYRQHIKTLRRSFDASDGSSDTFSTLCQQGYGIVTFGDEGAYYWTPPGNQDTVKNA